MDAEELVRGIEVFEVELAPGRAEAFRDEVLASAKASGAEVLVLDGDMVFGRDHLGSAVYHAQKAIDDGRNSSESLAMETMLYASGERQLGSAIKKMTVSPGTRTVVVAVLRGLLEDEPNWRAVDAAQGSPSRAMLRRFGLTDEEMDTVDPDRLRELVMEKVASVDVIKK
jgi:tRNA threonylcarbamoyladenosine modification (KEOPS) complex Cgi121 subunit